jgi:hypothetical protein
LGGVCLGSCPLSAEEGDRLDFCAREIAIVHDSGADAHGLVGLWKTALFGSITLRRLGTHTWRSASCRVTL